MHLYTPVINFIVRLETHIVVTDVCVFLCLPGANMTQSLSSQPAARRLPDLILQRIEFYRFPHAKTNTNTFSQHRGSGRWSDQLKTGPQKGPELNVSVSKSKQVDSYCIYK